MYNPPPKINPSCATVYIVMHVNYITKLVRYVTTIIIFRPLINIEQGRFEGGGG